MDIKFVCFYTFLTIYQQCYCIDVYIPKHIQECYRSNSTDLQNDLRIPMSIKILIELLQKIENSQYSDMRALTTTTLFHAKFDGIQRSFSSVESEHIIPAGLTGIHFNKFRLLMTYLLSGNAELFPRKALSTEEFCTLHFLVSSSVQQWERGDERRSCSGILFKPCNDESCANRKKLQARPKSICPIENGVVKTNWGDITAGHLMMAISAALQDQEVKLMDIISAWNEMNGKLSDMNNATIFHDDENINNLWASTLAGDLGEVVAYQVLFTNNLIIGAEGIWNDSILPQAYYLPDSIENHWEMTLAEMIGGIDGLIIGSAIREWVDQIGRLRLSQVLDMYYSDRGINFDKTYKSCHRIDRVKSILRTEELVRQTIAMTKLLQYNYISNHNDEWLPLSEQEIETYSKHVVDVFMNNLNALTTSSICDTSHQIPAADIFTIMDGTWAGYDGKKFISALSHATDVSHYGSKIGFISGNTGTWMTNVTHSIYQLLEDVSEKNMQWPTSLSLSDSLATIVDYLENKTVKECMNRYRSTRNTVIIVLGTISTVNSIDLEKSQSLIKSIKNINPSTSVIYVTTTLNAASYASLLHNEYGNDIMIESEKSIQTVTDRISEIMRKIPGQIVELHCDIESLQYEDYITPDVLTVYEIHHTIIDTIPGDIKIEFSGYEYANLSICANARENPEYKVCKSIDENNVSAEFMTKQFCKGYYSCNVLYQVLLQTSSNKCTDSDCRYPDQARIMIQTTLTSSSSFIAVNLKLLCFIAFITKFL